MINLQNYEEYFVRYMDGECSAREIAAVESFLQEHPHLNNELKALRATLLIPDQLSFPDKDLLKKGITTLNYESYFSRKIDNDLSAAETAGLGLFLNEHPQLVRELKAYEKTRLRADLSISFPDKNLLKKRSGLVVGMYMRYALITAVAACLMLIVMLRGFEQKPSQGHEMAQQSTTTQQLGLSNQPSKNSFNKHPEVAEKPIVLKNKKAGEKQDSLERNRMKFRNGLPSEFADASIKPLKALYRGNDSNVLKVNEALMSKIQVDLQPISYKASSKKATYRRSIPEPYNPYVSAEDKQPVKFTTVAAAFGGELLRLSGREDYLKTASAFNGNSEKQKLPLAVTIKGSHFNFYYKFFKKRNHAASSPVK